jgi:hypothetical protein
MELINSHQLLKDLLEDEPVTAVLYIAVEDLLKIANLEGKIEAVKESDKTEDQWKIEFYQREIRRIVGANPFEKPIKTIKDVRDQSR